MIVKILWYFDIMISEGFAPAAGPLLVGGWLGGGWNRFDWNMDSCKLENHAAKWALRHMVIDAKIVRHGRSAVVNIIEKHSNSDQKVIRMMPQRGLGPPFWCPGGVSTSFLGFWGSHVARGAPQVDLLRILGVILEVIWRACSFQVFFFGVICCTFLFSSILGWILAPWGHPRSKRDQAGQARFGGGRP